MAMNEMKSDDHSTPQHIYRVCGLHMRAGIPVKFGTAHGRSKLEVGSAKRIDANDKKGVYLFSRTFSTSEQKKYHPYWLSDAKTQPFLAYCL